MEFSICGHIEQVTDDELYAHKILKEFQNRATAAKIRFAKKYDGYQGFKVFATSVARDGYEIINAEVEYATALLIKGRKYGISKDSLYATYGEVFLKPWDEFIDELVGILEQSNETIEQATYAREMKKAARGRLVGGGFGLAGAAKGIATAGIFNATTGTVYSISNAIGNAMTRNEVTKKEDAIYRDSKFRAMVCERIYHAVYTIAGCVIEEYGANINDAPPRDAEMSKNLMNNYSLVPEEDRIDVLITALHYNRYFDSDCRCIFSAWGMDNYCCWWRSVCARLRSSRSVQISCRSNDASKGVTRRIDQCTKADSGIIKNVVYQKSLSPTKQIAML